MSRSVVVLALGTTQTLAWASSYYLPAILADPIARELGISATAVFAAFSAAWVVPSLIGPFLAGAVTEYMHWRWVFLGVAALTLVAFTLIAL